MLYKRLNADGTVRIAGFAGRRVQSACLPASGAIYWRDANTAQQLVNTHLGSRFLATAAAARLNLPMRMLAFTEKRDLLWLIEYVSNSA
ncbi:MAG: hypothetical protein P4L77_15250 [Sulfuriferula sp.]|nr:hypothetical protein [Sulfuriferula sp.]